MNIRILAVLAAFHIAACSRPDSPELSNAKNIFEQDDRSSVAPDTYPLQAVGRLEAPGDKWCTAFLVAPHLAVTNAHCMASLNSQLTFYRGYHDGDWLEKSAIVTSVRGTTDTNNRINDWAILLLERDMEIQQWFEFDFDASFASIDPETEQEERESDTDGPYSMAGYPGDRDGGHSLTFEDGCQVFGRNAEWRYLYHDCDNTEGASGSPIYYLDEEGQAKVVAINSAERFEDWNERTPAEVGAPYRHHIANLATSLRQIEDAFLQTSARFPAGVDRSLPPARDLEICNRTAQKVYAALAYKDSILDERPFVRGWYSVEAESCRQFALGTISPVMGFAYPWTASRPAADEGWPLVRDEEFCVNGRAGFILDSDLLCRRNETDYLFQPFGLIPDPHPADPIILWEIEER